jgi:zinc finger protein 830
MADVRALLKNERAARKIHHKHASYSATGTLLCTVCRLQLKSESLWDGHLRSAGHIMRLQKLEDSEQRPEPTTPEAAPNVDGNKKRKASDDEDTTRKRTKAAGGLPEGFFDAEQEQESEAPAVQFPPKNEIRIPSRPATPLKPAEAKPTEVIPKISEVNEDEWAAFEADIAAAEVPAATSYTEGVISAPAMSAAELAAKEKEEENKRKRERLEAELEGDKEDAARKLEDEFEEMEGLEQRVKKLREKREALRKKESVVGLAEAPPIPPPEGDTHEEDEEDEDEDDADDDDWDGFRMKG